MLLMLVVIMFGLLFIGFPMFMSLLVASMAVILVYFPNVNPIILSQQLINGISSSVLLAVPMFIFAADIMCVGETSKRLLNFIGSFVRHISGGLAITTGATCTLFGAISGSTQATVVAVGKPMKREMTEAGYREDDTVGLIINTANIALLIPPSVVMIMYCVVTGTSVAELFMAGIGPGIVLFLLFAIYSFFLAKVRHTPKQQKATWKERAEAFKQALLPLGFPAIILGGIYTGIFSPTEAAAVSVLYAAIIEVFVFKTITIKDIPKIAKSTGLLTATIFILVACGQAFSWVISYAQIPQMLTALILGDTPTKTQILIVVTIFYFIGCMFVDQMVVILILTPIFYPLAVAAGIDPIHLGLIISVQCAIGSATPPFGCNIFTASAIFKIPYLKVVKGIPPFIILLVFASILFIVYPSSAMWFYHLIY
ncbi:TRAP transporter large permease [Clostridium sp. MD294]|uniref:TRAP transporter large permease n=1 Tax=Clostridium sp. MD294 TaxID=97138 RepID=UPI0002C9668A|nr:TRAP transporter large permease [Clostridium sp. MD294]NDO45938.1 TRAP transporter large permease [Clostridium sp. MD294]USF30403.1 Ectoine TRAP transporter large permease protein TeaC [Clostridium sp. MD294]